MSDEWQGHDTDAVEYPCSCKDGSQYQAKHGCRVHGTPIVKRLTKEGIEWLRNTEFKKRPRKKRSEW